MIELTKSQKKTARKLINLGLQRECAKFMQDGVLTDEDIREFDDELYNSLKEAKKSFQN